MQRFKVLFLILCGLLLSHFPIAPVQAETFQVTRTDDPTPGACDPNDCSLREAVLAADANGMGEDTIQLADETYQLSIPEAGSPETGDLDVVGDLIVLGIPGGNTTINAEASLADRIFNISSASPVNFSISDVTLQNGTATGPGGAIYFGAIQGKMTVTSCRFENNQATGPGGAIRFSHGGAAGNPLIVTDSIFINNKSTGDDGGAISFSTGSNILEVRNSQFNQNMAPSGDGGAIYCSTGATGGEHIIANSQFQQNSSQGNGGAIYYTSSAATGYFSNLDINDNDAGNGGGGIYWTSATPAGNFALTLDRVSVWKNNSVMDGAGLYFSSSASAMVVDSAFQQNETEVAMGGSGGGAYFSSGDITDGVDIYRSTFNNNYADLDGGGFYITTSGRGNVVNTTVSMNTSANEGGGIVFNTPNISFLGNSTIYSNTADEEGGGITDVAGGNIEITNTILDGNMATLGPDCFGDVMSLGYNLIGSVDGCTATTVGTDTLGEDPMLAALADNGGPLATDVGLPPIIVGPPWTHRLLDGSPAIDGGDPAGCADEDGTLLATDERGQTRPAAGCDIGAYERGNLTLALSKTADPDPVVSGLNLTYTLVLTNQGPDIAFNVLLTDTLPASVTFDSVSTTEGTCDEASGTITCLVDQLDSGEEVTVMIVTTVIAEGPFSITNRATLAATDATEVEAEITTQVVDTSGGCSCRMDGSISAKPRAAVVGLFLLFGVGLALFRKRVKKLS